MCNVKTYDIIKNKDKEKTDQDWRRQEEVVKGVVQQVTAGRRVKICVTHQLTGEQCLPGTAAQQAAHLTVGRVHFLGQRLQVGTKASESIGLHTRRHDTVDI